MIVFKCIASRNKSLQKIFIQKYKIRYIMSFKVATPFSVKTFLMRRERILLYWKTVGVFDIFLHYRQRMNHNFIGLDWFVKKHDRIHTYAFSTTGMLFFEISCFSSWEQTSEMKRRMYTGKLLTFHFGWPDQGCRVKSLELPMIAYLHLKRALVSVVGY